MTGWDRRMVRVKKGGVNEREGRMEKKSCGERGWQKKNEKRMRELWWQVAFPHRTKSYCFGYFFTSFHYFPFLSLPQLSILVLFSHCCFLSYSFLFCWFVSCDTVVSQKSWTATARVS